MSKSHFLSLAKGNIRNLAAQQIYLKTGADVTRPAQVYALVNKRCNARCRMCNCWRGAGEVELPASTWIRFIDDLKDYSNDFTLSISGGEPLLKKDLYEILGECKARSVATTVTSNGLSLNASNIQKLLDSRLFALNISVDSMIDEINDDMRGVPGILAKVKKNLSEFTRLNESSPYKTRLIIKSVVCSQNLEGLHLLAEYVKDAGLTGVSYQPIFEWSEDSKGMMDVDPTMVSNMVQRLIQMKKSGYPILNSESSMLQWNDYFTTGAKKTSSTCNVPLRNLFVTPDGNMNLCAQIKNPIGNIQTDLVSEVWNNPKTREIRKALVNCQRLCLATCTVKRTFKDYVDLCSKLFR